MSTDQYPTHSDIDVHSGETIYRTDEWWKAALTHSYGGGDEEIAIYLWHRDDDWTRKNKYHVRTAEAWQADKELIEQYLSEVGQGVDAQSAFPVSDYFHISQGETVFKTDEWWKAVVSIDQKGSYETHEVIIYLWQHVEGDWRRRQKYAIKDLQDWEEDETAVDALLDGDVARHAAEGSSASPTNASPSTATDAASPSAETELETASDGVLEQVEAEIKDLHLGSGVGNDG